MTVKLAMRGWSVNRNSVSSKLLDAEKSLFQHVVAIHCDGLYGG